MGRIITTGVARTGTGPYLGSLQAQENVISSIKTNNNIAIDPVGTGVVDTDAQLRVTNSSVSDSSSSGAVIVSGGVGVSQDVFVGGTLSSSTGFTDTPIGNSTPVSGGFTDVTVTGLTTFTRTAEVVASKTGATSVVVHDFTEANTWYHSSISGDFTVNLTNTPTIADRSYTITLILQQGATPYVATAFQINGSPQTVRWAGYGYPVGTANARNIQTFTLIRTGSSWTIFCSTTAVSTVLDGSTSALAARSADELIQNGQTANGDYWLNFDGTPRQFFCPLATFPGYILMANWSDGASTFLTGGPSGLNLNQAATRTTSIGDFQGPDATYGYRRNVGGAGDRSAINSVFGYQYRYVKFKFHLYHYYSMDASNSNYSPYSIGNIGDGFTLAMNNAALGGGQHIFTYFMGIQDGANTLYNCPGRGGTAPTRYGGSPQPGTFMGNRFACSTDDASSYGANYWGYFAGSSGRQTNPYLDAWYDVDLGARYSNSIRAILHSDQDSGNEEPYMRRGCILVR
jgi:hypothetical protein